MLKVNRLENQIISNILGANKPKGLNRIAKTGHGHQFKAPSILLFFVNGWLIKICWLNQKLLRCIIQIEVFLRFDASVILMKNKAGPFKEKHTHLYYYHYRQDLAILLYVEYTLLTRFKCKMYICQSYLDVTTS